VASQKIERAPGRCPEHGRVEGIRYLPGPSFPFALYYYRLRKARQAPFTCPQCDRAITEESQAA
jgi:hypothetical protein